MKTFFSKIIKFLLLYLVVSTVVSMIAPYHWGNPWYSTKIQFLKKNSKTEYNTFFFGSSRVYRQIDPKTFDSTFKANTHENINSYNLGAPATFCPQSYYLYEKFLKSNCSRNAKYCFMELTDVPPVGRHLLHQERSSYWLNFSDILFIEKSVFKNSQKDIIQKLKYTSDYGISYFEKLFHLGHFGQQLITKNYYDTKYLGPAQNGFFPLELEAKTTSNSNVKDNLANRINSTKTNPKIDKKSKEKALMTYQNISNNYDLVNLKRIKELIAASEKRGIRLIFILSPKNKSQELLNLSRQIPKSNIIDMSNPILHSKLYSSDYSFDNTHLNTIGSIEYSKSIGIEFEELIKSQNGHKHAN